MNFHRLDFYEHQIAVWARMMGDAHRCHLSKLWAECGGKPEDEPRAQVHTFRVGGFR